ncbi:Verticillium wilt disease resistance protein [Forsythia ovata]|uniref:Verticillium wilt disease resistance protein n=1 Tax=Forsythia ovata TaxID=205694 RepID=A0ABD1SIN7_9LAMI
MATTHLDKSKMPVCSQSRCLEDQKILLLKLKVEFRYDPLASRKLVIWNENEDEDCCSWDGVECDGAGHVISLELDNESIYAGLENSTSLFSLQYLERLILRKRRRRDEIRLASAAHRDAKKAGKKTFYLAHYVGESD